MRKKGDSYSRRFDIQRNYYYETHDKDGNLTSTMSETEWIESVKADVERYKQDPNILEVLYVFHDNDINADGTPKGLHEHSIVTMKDAKSVSAAVTYFSASSAYNCQPVKTYAGSCQYLIHVTQQAILERKTIYLPEKVRGWYRDENGNPVAIDVRGFQDRMAGKTIKQKKKEQKEVRDECARAVMSGSLLPLDVKQVYERDEKKVGLSGLDYLQDKTLLSSAESVWLEEVKRFYVSHDCPLTTIYIEGSGGTGKTTLAEAFARTVMDSHGIHRVAPPNGSTTFDFVGNYRGERVSIFNEFSSGYDINGFLDGFDPQRAVTVGSRFIDKVYFANYAIFTTSVPLENWIYEMFSKYARVSAKIPNNVRGQLKKNGTEYDWYDSYLKYLPPLDNKIVQIRRRIPIKVTINNGYSYISYLRADLNVNQSPIFDNMANPYVMFGCLPFDITNSSLSLAQIDKAVECMHQAIDKYYEVNGFKHPSTYPVPDFSNNDDNGNC